MKTLNFTLLPKGFFDLIMDLKLQTPVIRFYISLHKVNKLYFITKHDMVSRDGATLQSVPAALPPQSPLNSIFINLRFSSLRPLASFASFHPQNSICLSGIFPPPPRLPRLSFICPCPPSSSPSISPPPVCSFLWPPSLPSSSILAHHCRSRFFACH